MLQAYHVFACPGHRISCLWFLTSWKQGVNIFCFLYITPYAKSWLFLVILMVQGQEQNRILLGSFPARPKCNEYSFLTWKHCLESDKRGTLGWTAHFLFHFLRFCRNSLERALWGRAVVSPLNHPQNQAWSWSLFCSGTLVSTVNSTGPRLQTAENYSQQKIKKNNLLLFSFFSPHLPLFLN